MLYFAIILLFKAIYFIKPSADLSLNKNNTNLRAITFETSKKNSIKTTEFFVID